MAHNAEHLRCAQRRRMPYLPQPAGAAKLSEHASGCGKRNSHCTKRRTKLNVPLSRRSATPPHGQYPAKVGVLGSAYALPNPFIMMGKGPEEVEDLLGVRSEHSAHAPHARCRALVACKAHARHVEPNGLNGARSSTVMACESGMHGGTGGGLMSRGQA